MGVLTIEMGEEVKTQICADCGKESQSVRGFVYDDGDAYSVYLAVIYTGHKDKLVALAVGIGDWDEGAGPESRRSVTIFIRRSPTEFQMSLQDAEISPWKSAANWLGRMLSRQEALESPLRDAFFHVADHVVANDSRVRSYLNE